MTTRCGSILVAAALAAVNTSCARPIARACTSNGDCGTASACVATRCESRVGVPALTKDERWVERIEIVTNTEALRLVLAKGDELELALPWPVEKKEVHESYMLLDVRGTSAAVLELRASRPREESTRPLESKDRVAFARTQVEVGDEVARIDLSSLTKVSRMSGGRYFVTLRVNEGRATIRLDETGREPRAEWYTRP